MTIIEILRAIAPEFANKTDIELQVFINLAELRVSHTVFGVVGSDKRNFAVALMAAHIMSLTTRDGNGGAITSLREGDLAVSFNAGSDINSLMSTSYGMQYKQLMDENIFYARTT